METYDLALWGAMVRDLRLSHNWSLRQMADHYGLPQADVAHVSRIERMERVNVATARRILRALGLLPPARRYHRVCMTPDEFAAWRRMTPQQRREALGL